MINYKTDGNFDLKPTQALATAGKNIIKNIPEHFVTHENRADSFHIHLQKIEADSPIDARTEHCQNNSNKKHIVPQLAISKTTDAYDATTVNINSTTNNNYTIFNNIQSRDAVDCPVSSPEDHATHKKSILKFNSDRKISFGTKKKVSFSSKRLSETIDETGNKRNSCCQPQVKINEGFGFPEKNEMRLPSNITPQELVYPKEESSSADSIQEEENMIKFSNENHLENQVYEKMTGFIFGFSASTMKTAKQATEKKLSICINHILDNKSIQCPVINFFGIFDGQCGDNASEMLKNELYRKIFAEPNFLPCPEQTICSAFADIAKTLHTKDINTSGSCSCSCSCAILLLTLDSRFIIANTGDSRAIISSNHGRHVNSLTIDHNKPMRIGDEFASPDILSSDYNSQMDFIIIGTVGLYEKLSNKEIIFSVFTSIKSAIIVGLSYRKMLELVTDTLIKEAIDRNLEDSISCMFICFENIATLFKEGNFRKVSEIIMMLKYSNNECGNLFNKFSTRRYSQARKSTSVIPEHINILQTIPEPQRKEHEKTEKRPIEIKKKKSKSLYTWCCGIFS